MQDTRREPPTRLVLRELIRGHVTPFLGAGANLCGRPSTPEPWSRGCGFYPSGAELAEHLADLFSFPGEDRRDLMEVASFAEVQLGRSRLYKELHSVFHEDIPVSPLHRFLARYRTVARNRGHSPPPPLVVTTNYDDALERALRAEKESFDVIAYVAEGKHRGKFVHRPPEGEPILIEHPSRYDDIALDERAAILKIHGTIDRADSAWDSFVIAEEQYIEYLTADVWAEIPPILVERMKQSHLLFLGYAMRDWNLLVILHRLGLFPFGDLTKWAIQLQQGPVDMRRWQRRDTESFDVPLDTFVEELEEELEALLALV